MLNRRHLRIKILQALYALEQSIEKNTSKFEKDLFFSIEKMYEMYIFLLLIMVEMRDIAEQRLEENKKKRLPTQEDLNPNTRFVHNRLLKQLEANKTLKSLSEKRKINWGGEGEMLRRLYRTLQNTDEFHKYMELNKADYAADKEVVIRLFKRHLINDERLQEFFEEKSIFWVDDLDLVASMTLKTLKSFEADSDDLQPLLPLWKESDDERDFVKILYRKAIAHRDEHLELIKSHADNWEVDRIALMDTILMNMALTEAREFNQIPTKVTLNEYIEISKYYSTPKSKTFINGVLDKLFTQLSEKGEIKKVGRGLIN